MRRQDFSYPLPDALIARQPTARRSASRLLYIPVDDAPRDLLFTDLVDLLRPGDLLVMNDTRVIPARLYGTKRTGGRIEILIERILASDDGDSDNAGGRALAQVRASKRLRKGARLEIEGGIEVEVLGRVVDLFELVFHDARSVLDILYDLGHVPLPPYIDRPDSREDRERYQTVYAARPGAVAAPTAGLHFDAELLDSLDSKGIERCFVTLHVGAGTFQPVRVERLDDHVMHSEYVEVGATVCAAVNKARACGGRVIAVGTTSVRALETAMRNGEIRPYAGETALFIYPGYTFCGVDAMITNFHLPESTLLMLVCAFGGMQRVLDAYRHAVEHAYRFYSYGDAMFVEPG